MKKEFEETRKPERRERERWWVINKKVSQVKSLSGRRRNATKVGSFSHTVSTLKERLATVTAPHRTAARRQCRCKWKRESQWEWRMLGVLVIGCVLGLLRVQCAGSTAQALMTLKFQL